LAPRGDEQISPIGHGSSNAPAGFSLDDALAAEPYCYLTTTGRRSGQRREIEIWFALINRTVYLLAGGGDRANWVRNLRVEPRAVVQIGDRALGTRGREPQPGAESDEARRALFAKYSTARSELTRWRDHGLLVALDLE
jgi:deazaflavin-dependent oxidoreductase (nitroreductase family)